MKLGRTAIASLNLPQGRSEVTYFDSDIGGFGIRIRKSGTRSWVFQYDNTAGKTRRITIGRVSAIDPAKARQIASELHAKFRLGEDPAVIKAQRQARAAETFGAIVPLYLQWQHARVRASKLRPSSLRHIERHLVTNLTALHSLPIQEVDRRTIAAQLKRMAHSPVQANRTRSTLTGFLNWCLREGLVDTNQALATNKNAEQARDRVLTTAELRALWLTLPEGDYGDILKILILTGARAREISDLHWSEINFEKGVIELPAHRVKNGRKHVIPMSGLVRAILLAREQNGDFVFGTSLTAGFSGWSKCKERLDQRLEFPPWRIHDLRRSASTGMNEIGIPPWIVEAILGHVSGYKAGVAGRYNLATHEPEKATALQRWAAHVAAIVAGEKDNITPLRTA